MVTYVGYDSYSNGKVEHEKSVHTTCLMVKDLREITGVYAKIDIQKHISFFINI